MELAISKKGPRKVPGFGPRMEFVRRFLMRGGSASRFAELLGIPIPTYQGWEKGHFPGFDRLRDRLDPVVKAQGLYGAQIASWLQQGGGGAPLLPNGGLLPYHEGQENDPLAVGAVQDSAVVPYVSAPAPPAHEPVQGSAGHDCIMEIDFEAVMRRALAAIQRGEDAKPILQFPLDMIDRARALGLAPPESSDTIPPADAGRSGGIGRRARFRV